MCNETHNGRDWDGQVSCINMCKETHNGRDWDGQVSCINMCKESHNGQGLGWTGLVYKHVQGDS